MGPIGAVGSNTNGGPNPPQQAQSLTPASMGETPASVTGVTSSSSSQSMLTIQSSVTQLLQSVGGGLEKNEMLKALIALLLLSALLRSNSSEEQSSQLLLQELGKTRGSIELQSQSISYYSSSTSFVMESSGSAIATSQGGSVANSGEVSGGASPTQIDIIA